MSNAQEVLQPGSVLPHVRSSMSGYTLPFSYAQPPEPPAPEKPVALRVNILDAMGFGRLPSAERLSGEAAHVKEKRQGDGVDWINGIKHGVGGFLNSIWLILMKLLAMLLRKQWTIEKKEGAEPDEAAKLAAQDAQKVQADSKKEALEQAESRTPQELEEQALEQAIESRGKLEQAMMVLRGNLGQDAQQDALDQMTQDEFNSLVLVSLMGAGRALADAQRAIELGRLAQEVRIKDILAQLQSDLPASGEEGAQQEDRKQMPAMSREDVFMTAALMAKGHKVAAEPGLRPLFESLARQLALGKELEELHENASLSMQASIRHAMTNASADRSHALGEMANAYGLQPDFSVLMEGPDANGVVSLSSYDPKALERATDIAQKAVDQLRDVVRSFERNAQNGAYAELSTKALSHFIDHMFATSHSALMGVDGGVVGIREQKSALLSQIASEYGLDAVEAQEFVRQMESKGLSFGNDLDGLLQQLAEVNQREGAIMNGKTAIEAVLGATIHASQGVLSEEGREVLQNHAAMYGFKVFPLEGQELDQTREKAGMKAEAKAATPLPDAPPMQPAAPVATTVSAIDAAAAAVASQRKAVAATPAAPPPAVKPVPSMSLVGLFKSSSVDDAQDDEDVDWDNLPEASRPRAGARAG